jgi:hypothetical protein
LDGTRQRLHLVRGYDQQVDAEFRKRIDLPDLAIAVASGIGKTKIDVITKGQFPFHFPEHRLSPLVFPDTLGKGNTVYLTLFHRTARAKKPQYHSKKG